MDAQLFLATAEQLAEKDDADCTPEELQMKEAVTDIWAQATAKKNAEILKDSFARVKELETKLVENIQNQATMFENPDVADYRHLLGQRRAAGRKIKLHAHGTKDTSGSEDAEKYLDLEKEEKGLKSKIAALNLTAKENNIPPIVASKRGGRKKKNPNDDGGLRPMDTGEDVEEESSESESEEDHEL